GAATGGGGGGERAAGVVAGVTARVPVRAGGGKSDILPRLAWAAPGRHPASSITPTERSRGCCLRHLRQGAGLWQQGLPLAPPHPAPLEPQHPGREGHGRLDTQATARVHVLHQGGQSHPLTSRAGPAGPVPQRDRCLSGLVSQRGRCLIWSVGCGESPVREDVLGSGDWPVWPVGPAWPVGPVRQARPSNAHTEGGPGGPETARTTWALSPPPEGCPPPLVGVTSTS